MSRTISVFIPAYNASAFLSRAIESVLAQSFSGFKLLILDDGSTDNTLEVASRYVNHEKVTLVCNDQNLGMAANWNKGISLSCGKYVAKLDADDFYHPDFLSEMVSVLETNPSVGLAFCGVNWITTRGKKSFLPYTEPWVNKGHDFLQNLLRRFVTHSATICVRRESYERLGGFCEQMRIHADWEMWTRIATHYDVAYINKTLASMVRHANNCTSQSQHDTRTPDDLALWLNLLDKGSLPYSLDKPSRILLEAAMIKMVRQLLYRSLTTGSKETTIACAQFLGQRPMVPAFEKVRYWLIVQFVRNQSKLAVELTRGRRYTEQWWALEKQLKIKLPARDPVDALAT